MSREPTLDELIGEDSTGEERRRLQHVHEQLLEAGPPPELPPQLEAPNLAQSLGKRRRRPRGMLLLAAALAVCVVFLAGYGLGNHGSGKKKTNSPVVAVALTGTRLAPDAEGALRLWSSQDGSNWPMTLSVAGLPKLPPHSYYEVYLFRHGKILGSCGSFSVGRTDASDVTVTLTSPYPLQQGDSWVVTRPGAGGAEPGPTVLRPVQA